MLQQPVRAGGLALGYALATSALVLVTFLASNLLLSVLGGIGQVSAEPAGQQADAPRAAVMLSAEPRSDGAARCERRHRDADQGPGRTDDRCAEQRRNGTRVRP